MARNNADGKHAAAREEPREETQLDPALRAAGITLAICVALAVAAGLAFGNTVTRVAVVLLALTTAQGWWRGALSTASLVVALLLAAALAVPVGRLLEPAVAALASTSGLINRFASMGAAALLVLILASVGLGFAVKPLQRRVEPYRVWDRVGGGALGLVEGLLVAMLVLWGLFAIEPIAQTRADAANTPDSSRRLARTVLGVAQDARGSAFGAAAQAANPVQGTRTISLADDFAVVSSDPDAMARFMASDAVQRLKDDPAFIEAAERLSDEPTVRRIAEHGLEPGAIEELMSSDEVLRVIEETDVIERLGPMLDDIEAALRETRESIREPARGG